MLRDWGSRLTSNSQRDEGLCVLPDLLGIDVSAVVVVDGKSRDDQFDEVERGDARHVPLEAAKHQQLGVLKRAKERQY